MNPYAETLVQELEIRSVPQKADWWNNYLKGEIRFVVGIGEYKRGKPWTAEDFFSEVNERSKRDGA